MPDPDRPSFTLQLSQNKYLAPSDDRMDVVLTVRVGDAGVAAAGPPATAELLLVDCSSSMDWPPTKIEAARHACRAAIGSLRDGVLFGVVEGTGRARLVYPAEPPLAVAGERTRRAAKAAAAGLIAGGGTAMSTWLDLARTLFEQTPAAIRHAVLLTDGRNESERTGALDAALDRCRGQFACDARGIGDDWEPRELQRIASVLRGSADAVLEDSELAGDFRQLVERAMGRTVPDLRLRLTTMPYSRLRFVKQVFPAEVELTGQCRTRDRLVELPTGAWGDELREYHLCLDVEAGELTRYEDRLLGTVTLFAGEPVGEPQAVVGYLTDDLALSSVPDDNVARVTGQAELGCAVRAGWDAFEREDRAVAAREWGTAVRLATELGNAEILKRLGRLVDVRDDGAVTIKDGVRPRDGFSLVLGSTISTYTGAVEPAAVAVPPEPGGAPRQCVHCGHKARPSAKRCGHCGEPFEGSPS
ncbi:Ca-activated chloride channel family protein [Amycolatopsis tolypomycina]|uniref:Ca-activated chloride channel family protein n=1 Tax=Amycolatopsis tolypomycina TaxID=208445 RepID=A0A1H4YC85_9PSEU|nr:VWA domain-containing protein [Amycolatopsis tolypomycina]SED14791.1 Ca-activated chloride channel family protein [Amycolatopsis tolypomycina]